MARKINQLKMFGFPTDGTKKGNRSRKQVLALNAELQKEHRPHTSEWGTNELNIPELDYYVLIHRFPELNSPDPEIRTKAWNKFMDSPISKPYRANVKATNRIVKPC